MQPLSILLSGHLSASSLHQELSRVEPSLQAGQAALLVDVLQMTGYDEAARALFVEWNARWRGQISRVAIITDKLLWRMVIRTMGLASRQDMMPFQSHAAALAWATQESTPSDRNTIEVVAGRLIEVKVRSMSLSETLRFLPEVTKVRMRFITEGVLGIVDMRSAPAVTPEGLERMAQLMQRWNLGVIRIAVILPTGVPNAAQQIGDVVRAAKNSNRRLFVDTDAAARWLGEVLTIPERVRLEKFLGSSGNGELAAASRRSLH